MNKLTFTLNAAWMSAILLSTLSLQGMETVKKDKLDKNLVVSEVEEYNNNICSLTNLPNEKLLEIFSHCVDNGENQIKLHDNKTKDLMRLIHESKIGFLSGLRDLTKLSRTQHKIKSESLKNSIKDLMKISIACKDFNQLLSFEEIGSFCKGYNQYDKNEALQELLKPFTRTRHFDIYKTNNRLPAIILICAGANPDIEAPWLSLLGHAISGKDIELAEILIKHNSAGLKYRSRYDNACLLHTAAYSLTSEKINLLLGKIPEMVNILDKDGQTPLDIVQKNLKYQATDPDENRKQELFRKYGGKTGQELQEESMILLLHKDDLLGSLSMLPRDVRKSIVQHMMHFLKK